MPRSRPAALLLPAACLLLPVSAAWPQPVPQRLTDLPVAEASPRGTFPQFVQLPGVVLFSAATTQEGAELWRSDGTASGTALLADLCAGCEADPLFLAETGSRAFFTAGDPTGRLLWSTNGTEEGTEPLATVRGFDNTHLSAWFPAAGRLIFEGLDAAGPEPWVSDGTPGGTHRIADLTPNPLVSYYGFKANEDAVFFLRLDIATGLDTLLKTDGTAGGTLELGTFERQNEPWTLVATRHHAFLEVISPEDPVDVWISAGTPASTRSLRSLAAGLAAADSVHLVGLGRDFVLLLAEAGDGSQALWSSDGTAAGTRQVLSGGLYLRQLQPDEFFPVAQSWLPLANGRVLFLWSDAQGAEVWSTDGTPGGTFSLGDRCPGTCDSSAQYLTATTTTVFFSLAPLDGEFGLWATDGTTGGTRRLDVACGAECPSFTSTVGQLGTIQVLQAEGTAQAGLWRTDGTATGTYLLASNVRATAPGAASPVGTLLFSSASTTPSSGGQDVLWEVRDAPGSARPVRVLDEAPGQSSRFLSSVTAGEAVYFTVALPGASDQAWVSHGQAESTLPILDLAGEGDPGNLSRLGDQALLTARSFNRSAVWSSDGSAAGTQLLARIDGGQPGCSIGGLGARAYFFAEPATSEPLADLWATDGTPGGTGLVAAEVGGKTCQYHQFGALDDQLLFLGAGGDLYRSDGTAVGTIVVKDLGANLTNSGYFQTTAGRTFFVARGTDGAPGLWVTDGSAAGTQLLTPLSASGGDYAYFLTAAANLVFFIKGTSDSGFELWRTDGSESGTRIARDIHPGRFSANPWDLIAAGHNLFFTADDGVHGTELWVTDGTEAGTRLVRDLFPGLASASPKSLLALGDRIVFAASDGRTGRELWISDGTSAGTQLLLDLAPGAASSNPQPLGATGGRLYFAADDHQHGTQLWTLDLSTPTPCSTPNDLCLRDGRVQLRVHWRDARSGNEGDGVAVPFSDRTGFFWFFTPENLELVVKVLDGATVNGHLWTFYGALSDVEYWLEVTDLATGASKTYHNPQGEICGVGDTLSLPVPPGELGVPERDEGARATAVAASCASDADTLCLLDRFAVEVSWHDQHSGTDGHGTVATMGAQSGTFSFFNPANLELVVKMLDGRPVNGQYWFFFGALSDVEYAVRVRDTQTGAERTYTNPPGEICGQAHVDAFDGE